MASRDIREEPADNLDHEQLQDLPDGDCMKTSMIESEREEDVEIDVARFRTEFPAQRKEFEKCISSLLELADVIDKTHKDCTIASITASSASVSAGILSLLGMILAPFTAGGSLILTATGLGLGAAAAATGLSASIYESVSTSIETKKAQELMNKCGKSSPSEADFSSKLPFDAKALGENTASLVATLAGSIPDIAGKGIETHVKALHGHAKTALKALAKHATAAGSASHGTIKGAKHLEKAFAGTSLAPKLLGAASTGVFLLLDTYNIVQDAKHLTEGAKAETAARIREKAKKLEAEFQELNKLYEELMNCEEKKHITS